MQATQPAISINPSYNGVTIDPSTVVLTISSTASPGDVSISAAYENVITSVTLSLTVTTSVGEYDIQFDEPFYELILEEWPDEEGYNPSITISATAVGTSGQGIPIGVSITYSNGTTTNETGAFFATELWYDNSQITATATFGDGIVRQEIKGQLDTQIDWLAKMLMKTGKISAGLYYLTLKLLIRQYGTTKSQSLKELATETRKMGVKYMQLRDYQINEYLEDDDMIFTEIDKL